MLAEQYLFQLDKPERALDEYREIEDDYRGTPWGGKAMNAQAWVLSRKLERPTRRRLAAVARGPRLSRHRSPARGARLSRGRRRGRSRESDRTAEGDRRSRLLAADTLHLSAPPDSVPPLGAPGRRSHRAADRPGGAADWTLRRSGLRAPPPRRRVRPVGSSIRRPRHATRRALRVRLLRAPLQPARRLPEARRPRVRPTRCMRPRRSTAPASIHERARCRVDVRRAPAFAFSRTPAQAITGSNSRCPSGFLAPRPGSSSSCCSIRPRRCCCRGR